MSRLLAREAPGYLPSREAGPAEERSCFRSAPFFPRFAETMGTFLVEGGHRLTGRIRPAGNKNAALPCLAATVLASEPVILENVPRIRDVETFLQIIQSLGAEVAWSAPNEVTIDASGVGTDTVDVQLAKRIRASVLLAGPLLARFGHVELPPPGGDVIGPSHRSRRRRKTCWREPLRSCGDSPVSKLNRITPKL